MIDLAAQAEAYIQAEQRERQQTGSDDSLSHEYDVAESRRRAFQ